MKKTAIVIVMYFFVCTFGVGTANAAKLRWSAVPQSDIKEYQIYRQLMVNYSAPLTAESFDQGRAEKLDTSTVCEYFLDGFTDPWKFTYFVSAINTQNVEGLKSNGAVFDHPEPTVPLVTATTYAVVNEGENFTLSANVTSSVPCTVTWAKIFGAATVTLTAVPGNNTSVNAVGEVTVDSMTIFKVTVSDGFNSPVIRTVRRLIKNVAAAPDAVITALNGSVALTNNARLPAGTVVTFRNDSTNANSGTWAKAFGNMTVPNPTNLNEFQHIVPLGMGVIRLTVTDGSQTDIASFVVTGI